MISTLCKTLLQERIIVILRGLQPEKAVETGGILTNAGARFLEVPLNTPNALETIQILSEHFRGTEIRIGAGTVLIPDDVRRAQDAGAGYILSPNVRETVIRETVARGLVSIPGFQTPTEAFFAMECGAHLLKAFPCFSPENIAVLKSVIRLPVFAVGGIHAGNAAAYLKISDGIGVGNGLYSPEWTPEILKRKSREFFEKCRFN